MTEAIRIWWWIFLIVALVITLVDVYLLVRVVGLARQIATLTGKTLPAAAGIASNTGVGDRLGRAPELLGALGDRASELERLTGHLVTKLTREGA